MKENTDVLKTVKREKTIDELIKFRDHMMEREEYFDELYDIQVEQKRLHIGRLTFGAALAFSLGVAYLIWALFCLAAPWMTQVDPAMQNEIQLLYDAVHIAPGIQWIVLLAGILLLCIVYPSARTDVKKAQKHAKFLEYRGNKLASRNQRHYYSYATRPPIAYTYSNPQIISQVIYAMQDNEELELNDAISAVVRQLVG